MPSIVLQGLIGPLGFKDALALNMHFHINKTKKIPLFQGNYEIFV